MVSSLTLCFVNVILGKQDWEACGIADSRWVKAVASLETLSCPAPFDCLDWYFISLNCLNKQLNGISAYVSKCALVSQTGEEELAPHSSVHVCVLLFGLEVCDSENPSLSTSIIPFFVWAVDRPRVLMRAQGTVHAGALLLACICTGQQSFPWDSVH